MWELGPEDGAGKRGGVGLPAELLWNLTRLEVLRIRNLTGPVSPPLSQKTGHPCKKRV